MKRFVALVLGLVLCFGSMGAEIYPETPDPFMGDYVGKWTEGEKKFPDIGAQVIALGNGEYQINLVPKIYQRTPPFVVAVGKVSGGKLVFKEGEYFGEISNDAIKGGRGKDKTFALERYILTSPTLGAKVPANGVVIFDGSDFDAFNTLKGEKAWDLLENGVAMPKKTSSDLQTKHAFHDMKLHLEFRLPFLPEARGQGRANSGVKVQGMFEVQVLDSYGLEGYWNECGALYKISAPYVNMCAPPLQWQTYDIEFRAARFNASGELTELPRMTVMHNGIYVQKDVELPHTTSWNADKKSPPKSEPGAVSLQTHKNQVQYRNIWAVDSGK